MKKTMVIMFGLFAIFTTVSCWQIAEPSQPLESKDWRLEARKLDVEVLTNSPCGLLIERRPLPPDYKIHHLFLFRDDEEYPIAWEAEEDWDELRVCSETNKAFGLIKTWQKRENGWSGDRKRIVEITLPLPNEPMTKVQTRTLVEMDDLKTAEGRSWINGIQSVSPDGKTLLVNKAIPRKIDENKTSWTHEVLYMDVATGDFKQIGWK